MIKLLLATLFFIPVLGPMSWGQGSVRITAADLKKKGPKKLAEETAERVQRQFMASNAYQAVQKAPKDSVFAADTAGARLRIHMSPQALLAILSSGEILNQHQTKHSSSDQFYDPAARLVLEEGLAGAKFDKDVKKQKAFLEFLAKYATVEFPDFANDKDVRENWRDAVRSSSILDQYGDIIVYLKDSVKTRATFTPADSGNSSTEVQSFRQKKIYLLDREVSRGEYFEAQIWGPISLKDVAFVALAKTDLNPELVRLLREAKVEVRLLKNLHQMSDEEKTLGEFRVKAVADKPLSLDGPMNGSVSPRFLSRKDDLKAWAQTADLKELMPILPTILKKYAKDRAYLLDFLGQRHLQQIEKGFAQILLAENELDSLLELSKHDRRLLRILVLKFNLNKGMHSSDAFKIGTHLVEQGELDWIRAQVDLLLAAEVAGKYVSDDALRFLALVGTANETVARKIVTALPGFNVSDAALTIEAYQKVRFQEESTVRTLAKFIETKAAYDQMILALTLAGPHRRHPLVIKAVVRRLAEPAVELMEGLRLWPDLPEEIKTALRNFGQGKVTEDMRRKSRALLRKASSSVPGMKCEQIFSGVRAK